jgi:hypothetical protein
MTHARMQVREHDAMVLAVARPAGHQVLPPLRAEVRGALLRKDPRSSVRASAAATPVPQRRQCRSDASATATSDAHLSSAVQSLCVCVCARACVCVCVRVGRYLYDLSREVQDLVCQLRDKAQERERRIRKLEVSVRRMESARVCGRVCVCVCVCVWRVRLHVGMGVRPWLGV